MAGSNSKANFYESMQYLATVEAVPRMFAETFPGVELLFFRACRPELESMWSEATHRIRYRGHCDNLLALGLLLPEMVQPGRKRLSSVDLPGGDSHYARIDGYWDTTRRAKGFVEVCIAHIPGPLSALAAFGPDCWPFFASTRVAREEAAARLLQAGHNVDLFARADGPLERGFESELLEIGFRYSDADRAAIRSVTERYRREVRDLILRARVEPIHGPKLHVVAPQSGRNHD